MKRILALDDEPALLRLIEQYLTRLGYTVDACETATRALELFAQGPSRYCLVLADLHVPDMEGPDLIRALFRLDPKARVLICSGYPFDPQDVPITARQQIRFLQKPFLPAMLIEEVSQLIGPGEAAGQD